VHKLEGMLNVKSKKCRHPGCTSVSPSFDLPGGSGRFCNVHKTPEMVSFNRYDVRVTCNIKVAEILPLVGTR